MPTRAPHRGPCAFCAILSGSAPAHVVLETAVCLAFLDTRPVFPGHTLVVPRVHREALADVTETELAALFSAARALATAIPEAMEGEGAFVAVNDRVSQSVPHVHVHVVPRKRGDGLRGFFWPRRSYASEHEAAETASRIRASVAHPPAAG